MMRRLNKKNLLAALLASLFLFASSACVKRVDVGQVLRQLPDDTARARFEALYDSHECQQRFASDDAECWSDQRDGDVEVLTGVSRSLRGYVTQPYTVQTHLKVRLLSADGHVQEVYYFADAGDGGLESVEGYGMADGRINVFCTTRPDQLFRERLDSNDTVDQRSVDNEAECVHQAMARGGHFAQEVKSCLASLRQSGTRLASATSAK